MVLGSETARKHQLKLGDQIHSAHGLAENAHIHDEHPFTVVGILKPSGSVVDNLILCDLQSVWDVHGIHHEEHDHEHEHDHDHAHEGEHEHNHAPATSEAAKTETAHVHEDHEHDHDHEHEHSHESPAASAQANAANADSAVSAAAPVQEDSIVAERPRDNAFIKVSPRMLNSMRA